MGRLCTALGRLWGGSVSQQERGYAHTMHKAPSRCFGCQPPCRPSECRPMRFSLRRIGPTLMRILARPELNHPPHVRCCGAAGRTRWGRWRPSCAKPCRATHCSGTLGWASSTTCEVRVCPRVFREVEKTVINHKTKKIDLAVLPLLLLPFPRPPRQLYCASSHAPVFTI